MDDLTKKEFLILKHLAQGLTRDQICNRMNIKRKTLQCHLNNVYSKLQVEDVVQAVVWFYQKEILLPEQLLNLKLN